MTTHPNAVKHYRLTGEEQEVMFARLTEQALRAREERQLEAEWPLLVNQLLHALAGKVQALEAEVATLRAAQG